VTDAPGRTVGDGEWAALRDAVPGFGARWAEFRGSDSYIPDSPYLDAGELVWYVFGQWDAGDEAPLMALLAAFEDVYARADDDLEAVLGIGVLEDVIHEAGGRRMDLVRLWLRLGPEARRGWAAAYRYTHRGEDWNPPAAALHPRPMPGGGRKRGT
jgi:hypothetical protein